MGAVKLPVFCNSQPERSGPTIPAMLRATFCIPVTSPTDADGTSDIRQRPSGWRLPDLKPDRDTTAQKRRHLHRRCSRSQQFGAREDEPGDDECLPHRDGVPAALDHEVSHPS